MHKNVWKEYQKKKYQKPNFNDLNHQLLKINQLISRLTIDVPSIKHHKRLQQPELYKNASTSLFYNISKCYPELLDTTILKNAVFEAAKNRQPNILIDLIYYLFHNSIPGTQKTDHNNVVQFEINESDLSQIYQAILGMSRKHLTILK